MFTKRLVCIGDSFTEGMCDDLRPDGEYLGWADRLAQQLAEQSDQQPDTQVQYANLAIRGKLLDQVVDEQIDAALALNPTIITFHAGPNDVLRRGTNLEDLFKRYEQAVKRLTAARSSNNNNNANTNTNTNTNTSETTPSVVLFTAIGRAGGTGKVAQLLADRFEKFNANVRATAEKYDCILVDLEPIEVLTDRRLWFEDRLHLNAQGHERVAAVAFCAIASYENPGNVEDQEAWWMKALPPAPKRTKSQDLKADALWVKNHMLPWLHRRIKGVSSGDGRSPKNRELIDVVDPGNIKS